VKIFFCDLKLEIKGNLEAENERNQPAIRQSPHADRQQEHDQQ
jgi:hypothetical protein